MKHELIQTENYLLIVDDLEKTIAHLPLKNSPVLEGVDLLPPIDEIIKSLQQPKYPVGFECEVERIYPNHQTISKEYDFDDILIEQKTTTNSQGQTVWVGKYIFND
jgi:hypothetical protein